MTQVNSKALMAPRDIKNLKEMRKVLNVGQRIESEKLAKGIKEMLASGNYGKLSLEKVFKEAEEWKKTQAKLSVRA